MLALQALYYGNSVRLSVCLSHAGIMSKRRHVARCTLHCQIAKCVYSFVETKKIFHRDDPFPLKSWLRVTYPLLKAASFDTFCLVAPQPQEIEKEIQLHLIRTRHRLSNEPSTKVLRCPLLLQNGDKVPKFVVFWTMSTIKDEKSAAKFHCIKTLSGKVVAQSIAFRVVSIYWQGVAPFP